jgi:D-arabinose 1-dehydrogenase
VLVAVRELRRIRDSTGAVKYIGISGYPVRVLCELAEMILRETGEPLDAVMNWANFTLQNTLLSSEGVPRLKAAGVDVVPNASPIGMGLLRREGVPVGSMGDFHPAPSALRQAAANASTFCTQHGEKLEVIAVRFALENWMLEGNAVGSLGDPASGVPWRREKIEDVGGRRLGVSVIGCSSNLEELDETMRVWRSILDGLEDGKQTAVAAGRWAGDHEWSVNRRMAVLCLGQGIREILGRWVDVPWDSPGKDYVRIVPEGMRKEIQAGGLEKERSRL